MPAEVPVKIAVMVPIHDKPPDVFKAVLEALKRNEWDDVQIVLDRAPQSIVALVDGHACIYLSGNPGWRSPCIAANAGLRAIDSDITIYNPSDVVQGPHLKAIVQEHFTQHPKSVLFGRVIESDPAMAKGKAHAGPVLQGSDNTRPFTYLTAYPTQSLRDIGGWDEAFQEGVCYEDDDLAARLWKHGLDFHFDDRLYGVHQSHERVFDGTNTTQRYWTDYRVGLNRTLMVTKHGRESAINVVMQYHPTITNEPGKVTWSHITTL